MKNIDSDLIRGNIDTIILKTMIDGDKYGLDIIKEVEARSNGTYELKQPTLYSCLKRLENQELISSYWLDSDIGGRRHYYKLTDKGHETLQKKQEEWAKSKFIIDNLLSNYNYDEYRLVKKDDYDKIIEGKEFVYEQKQSPAPAETADTFENAQEELADAEESFELDSEITHDEDYEHVNQESDIEDFNELESSAEQENFHDKNEEAETEELEPVIEETETTPSQSSAQTSTRKYFVDYDDEDEPETDKPDVVFDDNVSDEDSYELDIEEDEDNFEQIENEDSELEEDEDDSPTYVAITETIIDEPAPEVEEMPDQSSFENNLLARLRAQDEEEINTYVGDQKSYVNHVHQSTETFEDVNVVQDSLLDFANTSLEKDVDDGINEFSSAVAELSNFTALSDDEPEQEEISEVETPEEQEETEPETMEEFADGAACDCNLLAEPSNIEYDDEFTKELNELNRNKNNGFFNSFDNPDYEVSSAKAVEEKSYDSYDYNQTDSSDASFDDDFDTSENAVFNFNISESAEEETEPITSYDIPESTASNLYDLDKIISNNASSYAKDYVSQENSTFTSFIPKYTGETYKQKLSNLSAYSKVSNDEENKKQINEDALNKAKDIESLKAELEQEGIKVREFRKFNSAEQSEKTYLLSNKMKLINSLILLFGYVFILSAVYIILNNTNFKNSYGFSLKYFLFAFIPFGVYALYHLVNYLINPYKKVPAKLAPRILIFISLIITVQLLLITYCVNLQLGFYSFAQEHYNHLLWIIPTVISFAPLVSNIIYISLFYSKNFNV